MTALIWLFFIGLIAPSSAHSWPENPVPRGYRNFVKGACVTDEAGKSYPICGKDANGLDIKNLRPNSYLQRPCTFSRNEGNYDSAGGEFPRSVLVMGSELCVSWAANAHDNDAHRNNGDTHGVRIAISSQAEPTMADFDSGVVAYVPYEKFQGALVEVKRSLTPTPGTYTMQFLWDWPVGVGPKFLSPSSSNHLFARCMDVEVMGDDSNNNDNGNLQALSDWPMGTHVRPIPATCQAGSYVYGTGDPKPPGSGETPETTFPSTQPDPAPTGTPPVLPPQQPATPVVLPVVPPVVPPVDQDGDVAEDSSLFPLCADCQNSFGTDTTAYCNYNGHCHAGDNEGKCCDPTGRAQCKCRRYKAPSAPIFPAVPIDTETPVVPVAPAQTTPAVPEDQSEEDNEQEDLLALPSSPPTLSPSSPHTPPPITVTATPTPAPMDRKCAQCTGAGAYCNYNGHCHAGDNEGKCCDPNARAKCKCRLVAQVQQQEEQRHLRAVVNVNGSG